MMPVGPQQAAAGAAALARGRHRRSRCSPISRHPPEFRFAPPAERSAGIRQWHRRRSLTTQARRERSIAAVACFWALGGRCRWQSALEGTRALLPWAPCGERPRALRDAMGGSKAQLWCERQQRRQPARRWRPPPPLPPRPTTVARARQPSRLHLRARCGAPSP